MFKNHGLYRASVSLMNATRDADAIPSVRLSVTLRYCIKTTINASLKFFHYRTA